MTRATPRSAESCATGTTTPGIGAWIVGLSARCLPRWAPIEERYFHIVDFVTNQVPAGAVLDVNLTNPTAGPAGTSSRARSRGGRVR